MEDHSTFQDYKLPDSLSSERMLFVMAVKENMGDSIWPAFKQHIGPFIYFNGDKSEVFFPSSQVLDKLDDHNRYSEDYVLTQRTDSIPFHFEVMISFNEEDSARHYYDHPVQQVLSVEETEQFIPSVQSTEMWSTMVIHEMFHQFQYVNPGYGTYAKNQIGNLPYDIRDLMEMSHGNEAFLSAVQKENEFLLQAISEKDETKMRAHLEDYLQSRKERIKQFFGQNDTLETVENYYILQEGSARYAEYQSMRVLNRFSKNKEDHDIAEDPMFKDFSEFEELDLTHPDFSFLTYAGAPDYHYALGFNTLRILDILGIEYKSTLLGRPDIPLHEYIARYLNTKS
ncbi:hypothetical protein AB2B38_003185 [Balneola sp. MJW-20]